MQKNFKKIILFFFFICLIPIGISSVQVYANNDNNVAASTPTDATATLESSELSTPVLKNKTEAADGGIKVSWDKVDNASGYAVFRKKANGSWSMIDTTTSTYYIDTTVTTGTKYYYTVRAYKGSLSTAKSNKYDSNYWSECDENGIAGKYIKSPTLKSATVTTSGTKITWKSVSNASGYVIYRKASGGSWERIGTSKSTSYTDKSSLTSGKTYYYKVKTYEGTLNDADANSNNSLYWSYSGETGLKNINLSSPKLYSKTTAANGGIKIQWKKVSSASGYIVYRKDANSNWKIIGKTTSTEYIDTTMSSGKTYYYTVRAYKGSYSKAIADKYNAAYWSSYSINGVKGKYIKAPEVTASRCTSGSTKLTWNSVSGAKGYTVWRKTSGGSWSKIANVTSTSYTDTAKLSSGTTYYYTVRAYSESYSKACSNTYNSLYWSYYNTSGAKSFYLKSPVLNATSYAEEDGIKITWKSVSDASGYAVYRRKYNEESWSLIDTTTSTSYTDTTSLLTGTTYYYTIRAYKGSVTTAVSNKYNAAYWSGYDSDGIKVKITLRIPTLKNVSKASSGVKVTWSSVSGATGYAVYRRSLGGDWNLLGTTTSTSYIDKSSLSSDGVYYYTVRAYKGSLSNANSNKYSTEYWSRYDTTGIAYSSSAINLKAQQYRSDTKYLILVNLSTHKVAIYTGSQYNWTRVKYVSCSSGKGNKTPTGIFKTGGKIYERGYSYASWYCTSIIGNNLFHSVLYEAGSKTKLRDGRLGLSISDGCIRLAMSGAKYIYDNIPAGTKVVIYK